MAGRRTSKPQTPPTPQASLVPSVASGQGGFDIESAAARLAKRTGNESCFDRLRAIRPDVYASAFGIRTRALNGETLPYAYAAYAAAILEAIAPQASEIRMCRLHGVAHWLAGR